jgi:hypothetical protein
MYINNNNISIWELPMSRNWVILPPPPIMEKGRERKRVSASILDIPWGKNAK